MPVEPIARTALGIDLSARFPVTTAITGSPATSAETIIATLTIANFANIAVVSGIQLSGWVAYTVGTSGTAVQIRIRQTNVSGTVIVASGALAKTAAQLYVDDVAGTDAGAGVGVYVLTMIVTSGAAISTVSATSLSAIVV
jgi:hypothetical protein